MPSIRLALAAVLITLPLAAQKTTTLPIRQVSLYKNGVALIEQSGTVTGDALIRIDFTSAQLNDVLQSLTAVDSGGGHVAGLNFESTATLREQLQSLSLGLNDDPTVEDFLRAIKGSPVEIHTKAGTVTGNVVHLEVRNAVNPKTGESVEHRVLTVITPNRTLRTVELLPSVEVRLLSTDQRQEIGRYLQIVADSRTPGVRHLLLEDTGTGTRQLRISYINAMPAWRSNYRLQLPNPKAATQNPAQTPTLQGWAVVANNTAADWQNIHLTLVSGLPAYNSSTQTATQSRLAEPISATRQTSVAIAGGAATQITSTPAQAPSVTAVTNSAQATSVDLDDVFETRLTRPVTIRKGESASLPFVEIPISAQRVSLWNYRSRMVSRALSIDNTSALTLDPGSFTILEDGVFAGQGTLASLHPGKHAFAAYGTDDQVKVIPNELYDPAPSAREIDIAKSALVVHRRNFRAHEYTVENAGNTPRSVILEVETQSHKDRLDWKLASTLPTLESTSDLYRFPVEVAPNSKKTIKVVESHAVPKTYQLARMRIEDFELIIRESKDDPGVIATLKPFIEARHKLLDLDASLRDQQRQMSEIAAEENRIRQNITTLKGTAEEKPLAQRYTDAMIAQEEKLAALRWQQDAARQQRTDTEKTLADQIRTVEANVTVASVPIS